MRKRRRYSSKKSESVNKKRQTETDCKMASADEPSTKGESDLESMIKKVMHQVLSEHQLDLKINGIKEDLEGIKMSISNNTEEGQRTKQLAQENKTEIDQMSPRLLKLEQELRMEKKARLNLECNLRQSNLKIYGVPERTGTRETSEQTLDKALRTIDTTLGVKDASISAAFRLGFRSTRTTETIVNRPILVKFRTIEDRNKVWEKR
jgi:chromosome segregation ATPase